MEATLIKKSTSGKKIKVFFSIILLLATLWGYQLYVNKFSSPANHSQSQVLGLTNTEQNPPNTAGQITTPAKPSITLSTLKISATPTGYLNVRDQPSLTGTVTTKVYPQAIYPYTAVTNGWYLITLPDDHKGWVNGQYITLQ